VWAAAGLAGWSALALATGSSSLNPELLAVARTASAALFLAAGVLLAGRAALTTRPADGWFAAAVLVFGAGIPVVSLLGPLLQGRPALSEPITAGRLLLSFLVVLLVAAALHGPPGRVLVRLSVVITGALLGCLVGATALARVVYVDAANTGMTDRLLWASAEGLAAGAWLVLAARASSGRADAGAGLAFGLMGLGEALRAASVATPAAVLVVAAGCQLIAGVVLIASATRTSCDTVAAHWRQNQQLRSDLARASRSLLQSEQSERERLHDARSAVAGLAGASRLLAGADVIDPEDRARVGWLMRAELDRLDRVLEPTPSCSSEPFDLAAILEPVLAAHRLAGGVVTAELEPSISVVGQAVETARAVANLLANVRSHAVGSAATVRATVVGTRVELHIEDDGPGIPEMFRSHVLMPGVRIAGAASGSGLGLATAAAAMAKQGGSLGLTERTGGGTGVVLTLPAGRSSARMMASVG
jgi:signal transduction histidine kinase